jgi:hypothetical protein
MDTTTTTPIEEPTQPTTNTVGVIAGASSGIGTVGGYCVK